VRPSEDGADVASPVSLMEWFTQFYPHKHSVGCAPAECVLRQGEMLFVPVSREASKSERCVAMPSSVRLCLLNRGTSCSPGQPTPLAGPAAFLTLCYIGMDTFPQSLTPFCPCSPWHLQRNWWHIALNLEEAVAVTQNYVSPANLPHVLRHLRSRSPALVSGCAAEARSGLYDTFAAALRRQRPELLQAVEAAEAAAQRKAEVRAGRGGCRMECLLCGRVALAVLTDVW
jgi:hypothetical protein